MLEHIEWRHLATHWPHVSRVLTKWMQPYFTVAKCSAQAHRSPLLSSPLHSSRRTFLLHFLLLSSHTSISIFPFGGVGIASAATATRFGCDCTWVSSFTIVIVIANYIFPLLVLPLLLSLRASNDECIAFAVAFGWHRSEQWFGVRVKSQNCRYRTRLQ